MSGAERSRKYREKIKNRDQDGLSEFRLAEKERHKKYRLLKKNEREKNVKRLQDHKTYERERKRTQRQKKKAVQELLQGNNCQNLVVPNEGNGVKISPQVLGKSVKRLERALPSTPTKKVCVLSAVVCKLSPTKRRDLLHTLGAETQNERKKRKDALTEDEKNKIIAFYKRDEISRILPGRKDCVSVKNADGIRVKLQKRILGMKVKEAHQLYKKENANCRVGLTIFQSLRPADVFLVTSKDHDVCMCVYHENLEMLVQGLNKACSNLQLPVSGNDLLKETVCTISVLEETRNTNEDTAVALNYATLKCCRRECELCGVEKWASNRLNNLDISEVLPVEYFRWKTEKGKTFKEHCNVDFATAKEELMSQLSKFSLHVYTAKRQHIEMKFLRETLSENDVIIHQDFAENYQLKYQSETMSAHFSNKQVSIFTCIVYFRDDLTGEIRHENIVIITNEMKHNKAAVYAFNYMVFKYIGDFLPRKIETVHFWTDGCGSQFKNRFNVQNIAIHGTEHDFNIDWSFFETAHGKGAVDGLGAVVKRNVWLAVLRGTYVLNTAEEFAEAARKEVPGVKIMYVDSSAITAICEDKEVEKRWDSATLVPGLLEVHHIRPLNKEGQIALSTYSCFVDPSQPSERVTEVWLPGKNTGGEADVTQEAGENDTETSEVNKGNWVAVLYDDKWWPGIVEKVKTSMLTVKPIADNKFQMLDTGEEEWDTINVNEILLKLNFPPRVLNHRKHFACDESDVRRINEFLKNIEH